MNVDREALEHLRSLKFTWDQIGSLVGVSGRTVRRRVREWGIKTYSDISDTVLDHHVRSVVSEFPNSGEVMMTGHLRSQKVS